MKKLKVILSLGIIFLTAACGYQFEGGGYVNQNLTHVAVKTLENKSSETGAGVVFSNALIREIIEKTDTQVVDETKADAIFQGRIEAITFHTLSRSSTESVVERRVTAVVDLKLADKEGNILWSVKDFSTHEDYTVDADEITDESNKREAVEKIADRSAEKLISKTRVDF